MEQKKPFLTPKAVKFRKDMLKWSGSSELLKKATDFQTIANQRIRVMTILIVGLFLVVATQLVNLQVYKQEEYIYKLDNYTRSYQKISPPRGQLYDRNGVLIVENISLLNMTYTPPKGISDKEEWELAELVASSFDFSSLKISTKDKKDAFIKLYPKESNQKISEMEWSKYKLDELDDNDIYELKLQRVVEEELLELNEQELSKAMIKIAMEMPSSNQPKTIKEDMSFKEASFLVENKELFKGFDVSNDWKRNYLFGNVFRSILGKVSTSKQGLPSNLAGLYLSKGYSRNERVGLNGLELQYEYLLRGSNTILDQSYDSLTGLPITSEIEPGKKGHDLKLSLDMALQLEVEKIVARELKDASVNPYRRDLENIYVAMMDPSTGEVLSLVGKHLNEDKSISDNPENTLWAAYEAGSVVKGATTYMGLQEGLISQGEYMIDEPIYLREQMKKSWRNMGRVNDIDALKWSSNVYMFRIAMRLGKANYVPRGPLVLRNDSSFQIMRNYFSKFGLGVMTGIDVPGETIGYLGDITASAKYSPGHLLDFSIGQYDTYTTIELAQYIATIANNGIKVQPKLLMDAYETGSDVVVYHNENTVVGVLDGSKHIKRVQEGFRACVVSGYCSTYFGQVGVAVAAKSGTAEATKRKVINGKSVEISSPNSTFVAYAPYDAPKVAIACAAPHAWTEKSQSNICQKITAEALAAYFKK